MKLPQPVQFILERFRQHGFEAYVVGGCVRDSLNGETPHDWDICTSALPEQTKACFADCSVAEIGIKHGTISVVLDHQLYEITTYRIDGDYLDNRHPKQVQFTPSLREDLARRDFTINAMAYAEDTGVVDLFGGEKDLKAHVIRCVGNPDNRFQEDALRILRALRFASRLNFSIEKETSDAIHRNAALLRHIAAERIREELIGILCGKGVEPILNDYRDVIAVFIPELIPTFDFDQHNPHHCFDVYRHIVRSVSLIEPEPVLRLAMYFHDIGKPPVCLTGKNNVCHFRGHPTISADIASSIFHRFRFSNEITRTCLLLITYHDARYQGSSRQLKRLLQVLGEENMRRLFKVQMADLMAQSDFRREEKRAALEAMIKETNKILAEHQCFTLRQLAVNGNDLKALGITDGKQIGQMLHQLLEEVTDDLLPNEKDALEKRASQLR